MSSLAVSVLSQQALQTQLPGGGAAFEYPGIVGAHRHATYLMKKDRLTKLLWLYQIHINTYMEASLRVCNNA